jgi:hypothetical protein
MGITGTRVYLSRVDCIESRISNSLKIVNADATTCMNWKVKTYDVRRILTCAAKQGLEHEAKEVFKAALARGAALDERDDLRYIRLKS